MSYQQSTHQQQAYLYIWAGIAALIVVHAIGRFAFTPLLPYFIQDGMLSLTQGANLATVNYLGYLIGALSAVRFSTPKTLKPFLLISLLINCLATVAQCFISHYDLLISLRLINGISNGIVFVLAPSLILEWLVDHNKENLSGLIYAGVPIGLILDSVLIDWTSSYFSLELRWLPVALCAIPLTIFGLLSLNKIQIKAHSKSIQPPIQAPPLFNRHTTPLFLAYAGAGLGYILPMTFLPALAHDIATEHQGFVQNIWLITSTTCLIFLPFWNWLGVRINDRFSLLLSYIAQIIGVAGVLIYPNTFGMMICAIFMGASFMGTVMCTQRVAKVLQPTQGIKLSALLISLYAGTQLLGPYLAKLYIQHGGTLLQSFAIGLLALIWGFVWMLKVPKYS